MKAVIYCRVSSKEQVNNLSLATQLDACRRYCEQHGFEVAAVFEDAGESAKTTDRPQFMRMLEYCRVHKKQIQVAVFYNLSRFCRNAFDHAYVKTLLLKLGVSLRSVTEPITDDSVGKFTENMLAAVAQFDNDIRADRTKAGMRTAVARGRWAWRAPLGFVNGNTKIGESSLIPDPVRAPLIRQAFELMASGNHSMREVLRKTSALGLVSRKGNALTAQTFCSLLRNRIYAGIVDAPGLGAVGVRGDFQAVIPEVTFQRVQAVLNRHKGSRDRVFDHPSFPLRRFVACGDCGTPLTGSASRGRSQRYSYYHCRKCSKVRVKVEQLETQFVQLLETLQPRPEFMKLFRAIVTDVWKERGNETSQVQVGLKQRIDDLRQKEARLEEAFLYQRHIDAETYERQRDKIREEIALAQIELEDAKLEEIDIEGVLGFAEHLLTNAARLWLEASSDQKRRLQEVFFPEKLRWTATGFGTAVTCMAFSQLREIASTNQKMASPPGFEPGSWP